MTAPKLNTEQALAEALKLRDQGALFVVHHSGGKDSQAMRVFVEQHVPREQILVLHADLPKADWEGTWDHVKYDAEPDHRGEFAGLVKTVAVKTLMDMSLKRGYWPSPKYRQCTSDLKRGPLDKVVKHFMSGCSCCTEDGENATTVTCKNRPKKGGTLRFNGIVINCTGLRAGESSARAKATLWKHNAKLSKSGRQWYEWLPIHHFDCDTDQRFDADTMTDHVRNIVAEDDKELHWAYKAGMRRLSCMFCIMASKDDLRVSAAQNPEAYAEYVAAEYVMGQTFLMPAKGVAKTLEEATGIEADPARVDIHMTRLGKRLAELTA